MSAVKRLSSAFGNFSPLGGGNGQASAGKTGVLA